MRDYLRFFCVLAAVLCTGDLARGQRSRLERMHRSVWPARRARRGPRPLPTPRWPCRATETRRAAWCGTSGAACRRPRRVTRIAQRRDRRFAGPAEELERDVVVRRGDPADLRAGVLAAPGEGLDAPTSALVVASDTRIPTNRRLPAGLSGSATRSISALRSVTAAPSATAPHRHPRHHAARSRHRSSPAPTTPRACGSDRACRASRASWSSTPADDASASHTVPTGFSGVPPSGPAMPRHRDGEVGAEALARAGRHLAHGLLADRAVRVERGLRDAELADLLRVRVDDRAADEPRASCPACA